MSKNFNFRISAGMLSQGAGSDSEFAVSCAGACSGDMGQWVAAYSVVAERGHAGGQNNLGLCLALGNGVERDDTQAADWLRKAAAQELPEALFNYGNYLMQRRYIERTELSTDDDFLPPEWRAVGCYQKAYRLGYLPAYCNLGWCYARGIGDEKGDEDAVDYYAAAAEAGDAWGLFCLGQLAEEGEDLQYVDFLSDWFQQEENTGDVDQLSLAVMLYRRAAESGLAVAQFRLGMCYFCGLGVPVNKAQAGYWFRCSAYTAAKWPQPEIVSGLDVGARYVGMEEKPEPFVLPTECVLRDSISPGLLIPAGAPVNAVDKDGLSPLHWAVEWNKPELLWVLLNVPGVDVNVVYGISPRNVDGVSPLHEAVLMRQPGMVRMLLDMPGVLVNTVNVRHRTPLYDAVRLREVEITHMLLEMPGIDVNLADWNGRSPLFYANVECTHHLLSVPGVDVNAKDNDGWSVLRHTIWDVQLNEDQKLHKLHMLLSIPGIVVAGEEGEGWVLIKNAIESGQVEVLRLLLSVPGIVVNPPHGGQTSVAYACVMGREDMASMLLLLPSLFGI